MNLPFFDWTQCVPFLVTGSRSKSKHLSLILRTALPLCQVNLRSLGRKRYAHLSEAGDEIQFDANVPWGEDTLFTLEFRDDKYAIHSCNNFYLCRDGKLKKDCTKDCLFCIEYHHGSLALRDFQVSQLLLGN